MLTLQSKDFSKWYNDVVLQADLAEYSPVKGCMIIKPYGYAIWENIQKELDTQIKQLGVKNVYFPLFIPESYLKKEAEHVKGFAPEVAWVTQGGNKKLQERLAIRPTSETIMYDVFSSWIQSYRDLPLKINQWANIVRWEMRPRLFLRTLEFLWQEGHTVHATQQEAEKMTKQALKMYTDFVKNQLAIHSIQGAKPQTDKFAGADNTFAVESLMKDGKALQMGTSHNLGQNFAKAFGIEFLDKNGKQKYPWQTSWGLSTRLIGGVIMAHGDDRGLILPPKIAPYQIVIVPISSTGKNNWTKAEEKNKIKRYITSIEKALIDKNIRFHIDWSNKTPGWKFNQWELKGVPLRLEVGPQEVSNNKITLVLRDNLKKETMNRNKFDREVLNVLDKLQKRLFNKSRKYTQKNTHQVDSYTQFKKVINQKKGFIKAFWCGDPKCEQKIQNQTKATIRSIPVKQSSRAGKCIKCNKKAKTQALFARAY